MKSLRKSEREKKQLFERFQKEIRPQVEMFIHLTGWFPTLEYEVDIQPSKAKGVVSATGVNVHASIVVNKKLMPSKKK